MHIMLSAGSLLTMIDGIRAAGIPDVLFASPSSALSRFLAHLSGDSHSRPGQQVHLAIPKPIIFALQLGSLCICKRYQDAGHDWVLV